MNTDNLKMSSSADQKKKCSLCTEFLANLQCLFNNMKINQNAEKRQWLTVAEVATELKISRSIVYRLIRNGELEAVNIVETEGKPALKGHFRIERKNLDYYLDTKRTRKVSEPRPCPSTRFHKVKNHLGI